MKMVRWVRFGWDLQKLPEAPAPLDPCYQMRPAERGEAKDLRDVLISAFTLDTDWNDALSGIRDWYEDQIDAVLDRKELGCVVISRGSRIIGASALDPSPDSENHLVSGPAILAEFRNRGLATALLHRSLRTLRDTGLARAFGVTKENVPTARYLYTKFGSGRAPYQLGALAAC